ncbi:MAG: Gfo/Idh/MocA family oxidoreductase [Candidatus Latescibacterota bacterium]
MTYRIGISGLRRGASLAHVVALQPDCQVAAACDPDPAALAALAPRFPRSRLCADYAEMLEAGLDVVVVASPVPEHCAQTLAALEAGCHVLQEVCLGASVEECRRIQQAVRAHPRQRFMLAENCCYWAHILSWQGMWRQGLLGALLYAEAEYIHDVRSLMRRAGGEPTWRTALPPIHYCTHSLGPLLKVTGERCVTACGLATPSRLDPGPGHLDLEVGLLRTAGGATIKILAGFRVVREPAFHYYSIYGTRGCLETARPPAPLKTHAFLSAVEHLQAMVEIPLGTDVPRAPAGAAAGGHGTAEYYMVRDFMEAVRAGVEPPLGITAALEMSLPGLCAHQSALQGGQPVEIPDWR